MPELQSLTNSVDNGMVIGSFEDSKQTPVIDTRDQSHTFEPEFRPSILAP